MPKWSDVIASEEYQSLPSETRYTKKVDFFKTVIQKSEKFKKLDPARKRMVTDTFLTEKAEEGLTPDLDKPTENKGFMDAVDQATGLPIVKSARGGVNAVADFIEPDIKDIKDSNLYNYGVNFPRQMAAEFVRSYTPEGLATAGAFSAVGKGIGMAAKTPQAQAVGKAVVENTPEFIKQPLAKVGEVLTKRFTVGRGQPKEYQEIAKTAALERNLGFQEAEDVAKNLSTAKENMVSKLADGTEKIIKKGDVLPAEYQKYVGRLFRDEIKLTPELQANKKFQQLKKISDEGREVMDKWSKSMADSGIASEETKKAIEENVGKYMATFYRSHLGKAKNASYSEKTLRLRLNGLKHKKELSEEVKQALGEIKEPAYPTAVRVKELSQSVANAKLFQSVAKNPEWTAKTNITGDMIKMPDSPMLGDLRGKWVVKEIGEDINQTISAANPNLVAYRKALGAWKYGKVVLNPATHFRNTFTNTMLLDLSGVNHFRQAQLLPSVVNDYLKKGNLYQMARKEGAIGGEFIGAEIKTLRDFYIQGEGGHISKIMNTLKMPFKKAGDVYQAEEQIAKLIKFADVYQKTGNAKLAAKEAQKWLFNYNEIPDAIKFARDTATPFITFTYKSVPRVAEAMINNPMKVYKYYAFINGFNQASRKQMGMSEEQFKKEEDALPPWISRDVMGVPSNMMLPSKNKDGDTQFLNLEYLMPFGALPDMAQTGVFKNINNPVITTIADLAKNRDFRDKKIVPLGASKEEELKAQAEHVYRSLAPSFAPGLPGMKGGYSYEKMVDAIKKRPNRFTGKTRGVPITVADTVFGLKVNDVDSKLSERIGRSQAKNDIAEVDKEIYKVRMAKGLSKEEKIKEIDILNKRKERLRKAQK